MASKLTIEELEPGGSVELLAVLRDVSMRTTKAGKPYLTMTLGDRTGEIQGRAWDEAPQLALIWLWPAGKTNVRWPESF